MASQDPALATKSVEESTLVENTVPSTINEVAAKTANDGEVDGDAEGKEGGEAAKTKNAGESGRSTPFGMLYAAVIDEASAFHNQSKRKLNV